MEYVLITILISLIILAVVLLIQFLIANEFYVAAREKGYEQKKYLWIPFLLGIVGYLLIIALPVRNEAMVTKENNSITVPFPNSVEAIGTVYENNNKKTKELVIFEDGSWECPECHNTCDIRVKRCSCGAKKSDYV